MSKTLVEFMAERPPLYQGVALQIFNVSVLTNRLRIHEVPEGVIHRYGALSDEGGVGLRGINSAFSATQDSIVNPVDERLAIPGAQIRTDVRLGEPAHAAEISKRTRQVARYIDHLLLNGNGLTVQNEIVGLRDRCTGNQLVEMATNGATLTVAKVEELVDQVDDMGGGRLLCMNRTAMRQLKNDIIKNAGGATVMDWISTIPKFEDVTIVLTLKNHLNTELLPFTETCGNSAVTASAYCIAPGIDDLMGVQLLMSPGSIAVINEGYVNSQKVDTIECAVGLAVYSPRSAARLKGILAA